MLPIMTGERSAGRAEDIAEPGSSLLFAACPDQFPEDRVSGESRTWQKGDSLRKPKISGYTCGLVLTIVTLGLYSYYVRELLASLALFSVAFLFLALVGLGAFALWCAAEQVAIRTRPLSRNVVAFSRRLITAHARS